MHKSAARYGTLRLGLVQLLGGALCFDDENVCFFVSNILRFFLCFFNVLERSVKSRNSCEVHSNVLYIQMILFVFLGFCRNILS